MHRRNMQTPHRKAPTEIQWVSICLMSVFIRPLLEFSEEVVNYEFAFNYNFSFDNHAQLRDTPLLMQTSSKSLRGRNELKRK